MVVCGGFRDVNLAALKTPCGPAAPIFVPQQRDTVSSSDRECSRTRVFFNRGGPLSLSPPSSSLPPPPPPPPPPSQQQQQQQQQPQQPPSPSWWLLLANAGATIDECHVAREYDISRE
ncbi:magnesium-chelatase subunit ChlD-like [Polyergus mexicanus]|uniref:magnesium-chelatase subunit ChlD-like n=1 Tax=Polyergus mexicanus TaxID=615972 RepID=UPI0038B58962